MAKEGLFALLCAGAICAPFSLAQAPTRAGEDQSQAITTTLAVQTAMQQAREFLLRGHYQAAVNVLETHLSRINGNREYLALLRDAYRGYVKELRLAKQESAAQVYLQRLLILDPGAKLDLDQRLEVVANPPQNAQPVQPTNPATKPQPNSATPGPTVRLQNDENENPFKEFHSRQSKAKGFIDQAEQEFANRRYAEAARLFEQAHQADQNSTTAGRERWGYCKIYQVVEQLNQQPGGAKPGVELEKEVRQAMSLAPRLESFGQDVLRRITERAPNANNPAAATTTVSVKHAGRTKDGWELAETTNFRIFHNQSRDYAERVAETAERTRVDMHRKWLGEAGETWNPKCDLYLHATSSDYSRATSVPASSPGHSTMRSEGSRVLERRIDLHCDDPNLISAVLPHEATHVVLAGKFGEQPVPRWVDEGIAVLSEPRDKVERHLRTLPQLRQDQQLFQVSELMKLNDYPKPQYIGSFYAQSVSVVEFLSAQKGPQTFTRFVREGMKSGYEPALKRNYGFQDFNELEQHWRKHAFEGGAVTTGMVEKGR